MDGPCLVSPYGHLRETCPITCLAPVSHLSRSLYPPDAFTIAGKFAAFDEVDLGSIDHLPGSRRHHVCAIVFWRHDPVPDAPRSDICHRDRCDIGAVMTYRPSADIDCQIVICLHDGISVVGAIIAFLAGFFRDA